MYQLTWALGAGNAGGRLKCGSIVKFEPIVAMANITNGPAEGDNIAGTIYMEQDAPGMLHVDVRGIALLPSPAPASNLSCLPCSCPPCLAPKCNASQGSWRRPAGGVEDFCARCKWQLLNNLAHLPAASGILNGRV